MCTFPEFSTIPVFLIIMIMYLALCITFLLYELCTSHRFNQENDVEICHDKLVAELKMLHQLYPKHFDKDISLEEANKILSTISIDVTDSLILKSATTTI